MSLLNTLCKGILVFSILCPSVFADDIYLNNVHETMLQVPWQKVASLQIWAGKWSGQTCEPLKHFFTFPKPEFETDYALNSYAFHRLPENGHEFIQGKVYNCVINKALDDTNQVLGSVSFSVTTDDGLLFKALPSKQILSNSP